MWSLSSIHQYSTSTSLGISCNKMERNNEILLRTQPHFILEKKGGNDIWFLTIDNENQYGICCKEQGPI